MSVRLLLPPLWGLSVVVSYVHNCAFTSTVYIYALHNNSSPLFLSLPLSPTSCHPLVHAPQLSGDQVSLSGSMEETSLSGAGEEEPGDPHHHHDHVFEGESGKRQYFQLSSDLPTFWVATFLLSFILPPTSVRHSPTFIVLSSFSVFHSSSLLRSSFAIHLSVVFLRPSFIRSPFFIRLSFSIIHYSLVCHLSSSVLCPSPFTHIRQVP